MANKIMQELAKKPKTTKKEMVIEQIKKDIAKCFDPKTGSAYCDENGQSDSWYHEQALKEIENADDELSNVEKDLIVCYLCCVKYEDPNCEACRIQIS